MGSVFAALTVALAVAVMFALGSASVALAKHSGGAFANPPAGQARPATPAPTHSASGSSPRSSAKHAPAAHAAGHKIA